MVPSGQYKVSDHTAAAYRTNMIRIAQALFRKAEPAPTQGTLPVDSALQHRYSTTGFYPLAGKRIFDLTASALGLALLSPLFALIGILIKLTAPGPIFFLQERVGRGGELFQDCKV